MNRYIRNIQIETISQEGQKKLLASKVLIAGAGGLGSTVIANLASAGIGNIGIIDSDRLELSNYNRQYLHKLSNLGKEKVESAKEWINEFNPDVEVKTFCTKLDEENYKDIVADYDIIFDCFDSYESKFLLNKIAVNKDKILIHGGVTEFGGQVTTIIPNKTACLNCLFDTNDDTYLPKGVLSPAVSTIASIQAMECIKVILGIGKTLENRILCFDGLNMTFKELKIAKNRHCILCGR